VTAVLGCLRWPEGAPAVRITGFMLLLQSGLPCVLAQPSASLRGFARRTDAILPRWLYWNGEFVFRWEGLLHRRWAAAPVQAAALHARKALLLLGEVGPPHRNLH